MEEVDAEIGDLVGKTGQPCQAGKQMRLNW
jgi:hypothetical protein